MLQAACETMSGHVTHTVPTDVLFTFQKKNVTLHALHSCKDDGIFTHNCSSVTKDDDSCVLNHKTRRITSKRITKVGNRFFFF